MDQADWQMLKMRLDREYPPPEHKSNKVKVSGDPPHFIQLGTEDGVQIVPLEMDEIPDRIGLEELWTHLAPYLQEIMGR